MEKYRAIPQGYMTVGELAKKMGVTVRTLQYYDKEGLLTPSLESDGGRRLYTDKDMVKLHQVLSMKYLGFSLDDIKNKLVSLNTPADVAAALTENAAAIHKKIESLSESLKAIETLKEEVLQMQSVNFKKYADIIVNLQMKNEMYWVIKHFDETTLDYIRGRFNKENGSFVVQTFKRLYDEAIQLKSDGVLPESERGQVFAKEFWDMITEFTGGDMSLLPKLIEFAENLGGANNEFKEKMTNSNTFIEPALSAYFTKLNYNPFENKEEK